MLNFKMCGFYKLVAINAKTGKERVLADWFPNLITNGGLDYMATHNDFLRYCYVGSSSTTPAYTDSNMGNLVAYKDANYYNTDLQLNTQSVHSGSPYYRYNIRTFRFGEGVAAGNLSEVGMGWAANPSGAIFSRALILDSYGNPTTITVLSDEYLDVTYEFRMYPAETDATGTTIFTGNKGASYDWTIRPGNITYLPILIGTSQYFPVAINRIYGASDTARLPGVSESDIGIITSALVASGLTATYSPYTNGNYYIDVTITVGLTQGNFTTGIHKFCIYICGCGWQIGVDPPIAKTSVDIVTITLRVAWSRK